MGKAERKDAALELAELAHELQQPLTGIRHQRGAPARVDGERSRGAHPRGRHLAANPRIQLLVERPGGTGRPSRHPGRRQPASRDGLVVCSSAMRPPGRRAGAKSRVPGPAVNSEFTGAGTDLPEISCAMRSRRPPASGPHPRLHGSGCGEPVEAIVEDDGPGVPDDMRSRLFKPFATDARWARDWGSTSAGRSPRKPAAR